MASREPCRNEAVFAWGATVHATSLGADVDRKFPQFTEVWEATFGGGNKRKPLSVRPMQPARLTRRDPWDEGRCCVLA
jgi:hypothetical protein